MNVVKFILFFLKNGEHFIACIQPFLIEKRREIFFQVRLPVWGKGILYFSLVLFYTPFTDRSQPKNTKNEIIFAHQCFHFHKILIYISILMQTVLGKPKGTPTGHFLVALSLCFKIKRRCKALDNDIFFHSHANLTPTNTPFAVHYEKMRIHLRETATNSAEIHSLAWKYEHLRINQIQLPFLHFNHHSVTHLIWAFICVSRHTKEKKILSLTQTSKSLTPSWKSIRTIDKHLSANTIYKHFYVTVCNSIALKDNLRIVVTNIHALVQSIERSLHNIQKSIFK